MVAILRDPDLLDQLPHDQLPQASWMRKNAALGNGDLLAFAKNFSDSLELKVPEQRPKRKVSCGSERSS